MPKSLFNNIILFIVLVISQAVIFNNLILFNSAVALVFLFFIIQLPITTNINLVLLSSFVLGLTIDIFQDTPGLNAMSCTIVAFIRRSIFHLYVPRDEDLSGKRIGIKTLGSVPFLKYALTIIIIYCVLYFSIEAISYFDIQRLGMRILASSVFTFVVIYAIDSLTLRRREKRL